MKIAHVTIYPKQGSTHSHFGGVAGYSKNLFSNTRYDEGDEVLVLCNKLEGERESYREGSLGIRRCFDRDIRAFFQLNRELKRIDPELIHVQHEVNLFGGKLNIYLFLLFMWKWRRKGIVVTLHNVVSPEAVDPAFLAGNFTRLPAWIVRTGLALMYRPMKALADSIIVHAESFKSVLLGKYGYQDDKVCVIPHGVEDLVPMPKDEARSLLGIKNDKTVVLFMGYATGYKGIEHLIRGFAMHARRHKDSILIIASGKHPTHEGRRSYEAYYEGLKREAADSIGNENHSWIGYLPESDIAKYYSAADALIFPYSSVMSSSGPMSLAMAYGKPVLLSENLRGTMGSMGDESAFFELDPKSVNEALDLMSEGKVRADRGMQRMRSERLWSVVATQTLGRYRDIYGANDRDKSALLLGSYGQGNLGDDILMHNYVQLLRECGFMEIIANASAAENVPEEISSHVKISSTYGTSILGWAKTLLRADVVVYGGGTIYKELYSTTARGKYSVILRMLAFNAFARVLGKRILNFNVGIGELNSGLGHLITKWCLKLSERTIFRDRRSFEIARTRYGLKETKVELGQDGIFMNRKWHKERPAGSAPLPNRGLKVGVSMLHDVPDWIPEQAYLDAMVSFCNMLLADGHKVVFLPFQATFNPNDDMIYIQREVIPRLNSDNYEMLLSGIGNACENMLSVDTLIGMRFHSLLLAISTATPFVAIEYDVKCSELMKDYPSFPSLPLEGLRPDDLAKKHADMVEHWESCRSELSAIAGELYAPSDRCRNILLKKQ